MAARPPALALVSSTLLSEPPFLGSRVAWLILAHSGYLLLAVPPSERLLDCGEEKRICLDLNGGLGFRF